MICIFAQPGLKPMDENSLVEDLRGDSMELVARLEVKLDQTLSMLASCMGKMALHDSKLANIETKLEELGERRRSGALQETSSSSSPVSVANANSSSLERAGAQQRGAPPGAEHGGGEDSEVPRAGRHPEGARRYRRGPRCRALLRRYVMWNF